MPTFRDLRRYVTNDKWVEEPNLARGSLRTGDHRRYSRRLADGSLLRTKISHDENAEIGADLFHRILRDQLRVTETRFWDVVQGRATAATDQARPASDPLPGWLVHRLLFTVGLPESEVATMTREEAEAAWLEYRSRPTE